MIAESYIKSNDSLDNREAYLFNLIKLLDKESFQLFNDTLDFNKNSMYKTKNLSYRVKKLIELFNETNEAFDYLQSVETNHLDSITKKFQMKRMLSGIVTINIFLINGLLAIIAFLLLNSKANKDFALELGDSSERLSKFDDEELEKIKRTLENCERILNGKINRIPGQLDLTDVDLVYANHYISLFMDGIITEKEVDSAPEKIKLQIEAILKSDLKTDETNLLQLLDLSKQRNSNSLKLIKSYMN